MVADYCGCGICIIKLYLFRLRVGFYGYLYSRDWGAKDALDHEDWVETYNYHDGCAKDAYEEGWCRE